MREFNNDKFTPRGKRGYRESFWEVQERQRLNGRVMRRGRGRNSEAIGDEDGSSQGMNALIVSLND
jgi:hypothetical protein